MLNVAIDVKLRCSDLVVLLSLSKRSPLLLASRTPSRQPHKGVCHGMASTDIATGTEQRMGRLVSKIAIVEILPSNSN